MNLNEQLDIMTPRDWLCIVSTLMLKHNITTYVFDQAIYDEMTERCKREDHNMSVLRIPEGGLEFKFITKAEADFIRSSHDGRPTGDLEIN